jgi:hypothetical protein
MSTGPRIPLAEALDIAANVVAIHQARQALAPEVAIPGEHYHEDDGPVLWWQLPVMDQEQPWVGTPNDSDWPGYHTHYTPLPPAPVAPTPSPKEVP